MFVPIRIFAPLISSTLSCARHSLRSLATANPSLVPGCEESYTKPYIKPDREIPAHVQELVERIAALPLLEVADLNYALKKRLNIPDQPMMMAAGMPMVQAGGVSSSAAKTESEKAPEEETIQQKTSFTVKLVKFDESKKIAVIKEIKNSVPGLNLVQAKKFIEALPAEVKTDIGQTEAEELKAKLELHGAVCEIV